MKFEALPLAEAEGHVLGHNVTGAGGRRRLRKGKALTAEDLELLRELGRSSVFVAVLEAGDVPEDEAAAAVAAVVAGPALSCSRALTGRVNLSADSLGLLRVDRQRLLQLNRCAGITLATLPEHSVVQPGRTVATLKVIPYAVPRAEVEKARGTAESGPLLQLSILQPSRTGMILSGAPSARERIVRSFRSSLEPRLLALASELGPVDFVPLEDEAGVAALAEAIRRQVEAGVDLVVLGGDTAIMDADDLAPRALIAAGGEVLCYGAPVDPGNLLMLGRCGGVPVVGAPGCARSPKRNIVDLVLPRLLAGDSLGEEDVAAWGHGGLLEDVPERPLPRSRVES